ncbi:MAG: AsmA-like C-terminal region-containing protein [Hyphomicrobiaceae bacterium]
MRWLAIVLGGVALVASLGYGSMSWMHATGDMLAQFRLQAAPRAGYVISEPVALLARPRLVLESAAIHSVDAGANDDGPEAVERSRRLILDRPVISVEVASGGEARDMELMAALEPVVARIASLDVQSLTIRGGLVKLQSRAAEPEVLTDVDIQITPQRRTTATVSGQLTYLGQRLSLSATVARRASNGPEYRWPVQAMVSSSLFDARLDGVLGEEKGLRLNGTIDISSPRLREIALWIGIGAPRAGNLEALRLRGALDWTGGVMAFSQATLTLDGNEGVGAISVTRAGERTAVEGTIAFKQLNLKPYVVSTMVERTLLAPIFAATRPPVIASLLDNVDADLRISCDTLVIPGVEAGQGAVAITLKNGKLLADVAELAVEEGVFKGQLAVERGATDPRYGLSGKLEAVETGRLLQRALGRKPLQGRADITLSLTTMGDTAEELLTNLGGKAQLEMRAGGRLGLDLRALAQSVKRGDQRGWLAAGISTMGLDGLALRLDVLEGVAHTTILQAKSGTSTFSGGGSIDLARQSLDFALMLGTSDPASRPAAGDVLMLSGPWEAPSMRLERRDEALPHPVLPVTAPELAAGRP